MQLSEAVLLGVLQGIAEWLPISSEGQTMLTMVGWLGLSPESALSYSIFLHLGTMVAVMVKFRREFLKALMDLDSKLTRTLILTTLCTGITGIPLYLLLRESFTGGKETTLLIGLMLIATGILLRFRRAGARELDDMTAGDMVILGMAQGLAILPGVSRSGTTISVLLMRNIRQDVALGVSFMISVPAVLGAAVLDGSFADVAWSTAFAALSVSFATGYLTMDLLIRFAREVSFSRFCIALGLITLALAAW